MTVGAPDWSTPSPGGAHKIVNDTFNFGGGFYQSGWIDCTAYSGLFLHCSAVTGNSAQFGSLTVAFRDALNSSVELPTYFAAWRGDMQTELNIPALAAQMLVTIQGPAANVNATMQVFGHGAGGSPGFRPGSMRLAEVSNATLAASVAFQRSPTWVVEGPGTLMCLVDNAQTGMAQLWAFDSSGARHLFARTQLLTGSNAATIPVWVPPYPIQMEVVNAGTASAPGFYGTLSLGRV